MISAQLPVCLVDGPSTQWERGNHVAMPSPMARPYMSMGGWAYTNASYPRDKYLAGAPPMPVNILILLSNRFFHYIF